ncbi:unnamed protein product [Amoebophrya sp. A120]|nr:unnamed protein product [Amoebophrya sp. A120]|eukprot:GSA120T00007643001.1
MTASKETSQAYMQVVVPKNCKPGSTFNVKTPDKQWMQVTVPAGAKPKQKLVMAYEPLNSNVTSSSSSKSTTPSARDDNKSQSSSSARSRSRSQKSSAGERSTSTSTSLQHKTTKKQAASDEFLEEQRLAYEALQDKYMQKQKESVVVEVPVNAKSGDLVQVRVRGGQLLQFPVPEGLDREQRFVNMEYESHVKKI